MKQSLRSAYNEGSTRREEELKRELDVKLCEKNAEICELKAEICEKNGEICEKEEEIKALKTRLSLANDCTEVLARSAVSMYANLIRSHMGNKRLPTRSPVRLYFHRKEILNTKYKYRNQ